MTNIYVTTKEAAPMAEHIIPPISNKRKLNNNRGSKQTPEKQRERSPANQDKSPPRKKPLPSTSFASESAASFEATAAGAGRDVGMLFTTFAEVFSQRAAADTSQMKELEGILTEARNLESRLKEKKTRLRQTLALISEKLRG